MDLKATTQDDSIPLVTTLDFSAMKEEDLKKTEIKSKRLAKFFIKDLIKAKKYVKDHITEDKYYFEVFGIVFKKVHLRATIVAIEHVDTKLMCTVDDGTASIRCFIEERESLNTQKEYVEETLAKISKMKDKDSAVNRGCVALLQGLQNRIKHFPNPRELKLGDVVEFVGLLNLYKGNYYIFTDEVRQDASNDVQHDIDYYDELIEYYRVKHFI